MIQDRQIYRKKLASTGSIFLGGEELSFNCNDVSAKGTLIELQPGKFITTFKDVESVVDENPTVEIFIKELQINGPAKVVWARNVNDKVMLGLEFGDVIVHAPKFMRLRRSYRKDISSSGYLIIENNRQQFECKNISADGLVVTIPANDKVSPGVVVEIVSEPLQLKGVATVIWVNSDNDKDEGKMSVGLRYLQSR